jgi:hypothetical protein
MQWSERPNYTSIRSLGIMAGRNSGERFEFVSKDDLLRIAFDMRDAQEKFYRQGRHEADKRAAITLERRFDAARKAYARGLNVAPLPGFVGGELDKP